jgi:D-ribulokinase
MAYVFGTSACSMTTTQRPAFVEGIWGPYFSAMVPGLWLNEGGQSAAGAAIDHLVRMHPAYGEAARSANEQGVSVSAWLANRATELGGGAAIERLVGDVHVVPEFLGNRAPFADPNAKALIAGIGMDTSVDSLVGLYLAGLCGLGYGVRQILEAQRAVGISTDTIVISGGAGQSPLVRQVLADATRRTVVASTSPEPVLLGSAILAAVAAGHYLDMMMAMSAMSELGDVYTPDPAVASWHSWRLGAFEKLQRTGREIKGPDTTASEARSR